MRINGVNRLACQMLVKDLLASNGKPATITIEPYLMANGNEPSRDGSSPRPNGPGPAT